MSYSSLTTHDDDLLPKFDNVLSVSAVTLGIKKILTWVVIIFVLFWICGKFLAPSDWTSYEQSTLKFCEPDNKHDFIRDCSVWTLIIFAFIILFLIWKLCHFTNKNVAHHLETFNWLFICFALVILFIGWWILKATRTLVGEQLSDLGSVLTSLWFAYYSVNRVLMHKKNGAENGGALYPVFWCIVVIVFIFFVLKIKAWWLIVIVIFVFIIISVCCETYLQMEKNGGFKLFNIICIILFFAFVCWLLGQFICIPNSCLQFNLLWKICIIIVIFFVCKLFKENPVV
ncbi:hypothetical protein GEMRC1_003830 [Eukaryota sp. GEM-RC1]